uniref:KCTD8/12/16 H1 domain-containing protein n=1 Tax=Romanomermis culicivorax TaxID=13658 RepID=A0A915KQ78_ROMCU
MLTSASGGSGGGGIAVDCKQRQTVHHASLDDQMISFVLPRRLSLHQVGHHKTFSNDSPVLISAQASHITVGYHGTFAFGPQGLASSEMNFRKISRILVCGRVSVCQEVFGQTLNDSRDPCHANLARNQDRLFEKSFKTFSNDSPVLISAQASHITVGYHGTFAFGPQGLASSEMNFRKISRILVCGRVSVCQEVFGQTLNDSRDPCHANLARNQDRCFWVDLRELYRLVPSLPRSVT